MRIFGSGGAGLGLLAFRLVVGRVCNGRRAMAAGTFAFLPLWVVRTDSVAIVFSTGKYLSIDGLRKLLVHRFREDWALFQHPIQIAVSDLDRGVSVSRVAKQETDDRTPTIVSYDDTLPRI